MDLGKSGAGAKLLTPMVDQSECTTSCIYVFPFNLERTETAMDDHDPDLDPIEETNQIPDPSDSELSDVDEEAFEGIDTERLGEAVPSDDEESYNVFALRPAKVKTGTGERKEKKRRTADDTEEKRQRRQERQERRQKKEEAKKRRTTDLAEDYDEPDPNRRPDDPEEARRWDLDRAMEAAIARKPVKRRKKDDDIVRLPLLFWTCTNLALGY